MNKGDYHVHMKRIYISMLRAFAFFVLAIPGVWLAQFALVSKPPPTSVEEAEYRHTHASAQNQQEIKVISNSCADEHCASSCAETDSEEQEQNEFIASKRDLNAQEGVWRASNAMAILTAFATIIRGIGLYLIRQTLVVAIRSKLTTYDLSFRIPPE